MAALQFVARQNMLLDSLDASRITEVREQLVRATEEGDEESVHRLRKMSEGIQKRVRWEAKGKRYLRGTTLPFDKQGMVRVDERLQEKVLDLMNQVAPDVAEAFEKEVVPVAERAVDKWPVDTGLSRALISLRFSATDSTLTGTLRSRAPYTVFINKGQTWRSLLDRPWKAATSRVEARIGRTL